ncbi:zinc transport system substrate-binding protein [Thermosyntropha lipolytica DSM 11003]|uniref:Zinc transport system substrate-binding protein n=1 Tax=Thermosyntropha lipolytica DSM 11003 TaxID=1123382 RepID=A0A1M5JGK6_9FIRM|nr:zinc ABC transporter substrate-binding protein [Thermosyntropha lipolytica]SHG39677.1 zinc transport system substrate-binding protein [Thermosyntropha lipolytica DSM 11003]
MKRTRLGLSISVLLILTVLITGCFKKEESKVREEGVLKVWVTVLPQADLVRKIGGELVEVNVLVPKGASPEDYEIPPGRLKELSQADVYFVVGHLPLERVWIERIKGINKDLLVVDTSQGIEIIDDNPHIWLSPRLVAIQSRHIYEALSSIDDENKGYYEENYAALQDELEKMDEDIAELFTGIKTRMFLTYHPAWTYLARDYGLTELAIEEHGKEPGPKHVAHIIDVAKKNGIKIVFASPQHSIKSAQVIAKELGGEVKIIDPLPEDYRELYETVSLIADAMRRAEKNK